MDSFGIVGRSASMRKVMQLVQRVGPQDTTVLVLGESGTGKELVARAVHQSSPRRDKPFVAINCAALTETLLESELFGHEKGAFTGAITQKKGKLESAEGGTVFLDEIGELAPTLQAKLLRVLQQREFERVGGTKTMPLNVRVVAATNRDLAVQVRKGAFREDLLPSAERSCPAYSSASRAAGGHPGPRQLFRAKIRDPNRPPHRGNLAGCGTYADSLQLARKCSRA